MNHKENTLDYEEFIIQSALNFLCINFHFLFHFNTLNNKQNAHPVHTPNKFHDYQQLPWNAKKLKQKKNSVFEILLSNTSKWGRKNGVAKSIQCIDSVNKWMNK